MKISVWDILTTLVVLSIFCVVGFYTMIFLNPTSFLNPLPPPTPLPAFVLPTSTSTPVVLPPTWTPTPRSQGLEEMGTGRATITFIPTATMFTLPTLPPLPPTPTITYTPLPTKTPSPLQCKLVSSSPTNGTRLAPNADFDAVFVVQNTGTATWEGFDTDFKFIRGTKFQTKADEFDVRANVEPGLQTSITIDMLAPGSPGTYSSTWGLVQGSTTICSWTLTIVVR